MSEEARKSAEISVFNKPLAPTQRGLIVSNQVSGKLYDGRPIKAETLRMLALFFDVIDIPRGTEDLIYKGDYTSRGKGRNADENFLISEEFITRTMRLPNQKTGSAITADREESFGSDILFHREKIEPGLWALATIHGMRPIHKTTGSSAFRALGMQFYEALPVPNRDVSLADCLAFRRKYSDELWELRYHIDDLCEKVNQSRDYNQSLNNEVIHLKKSADQYIAAASGFGINHFKDTLAFDLTLAGTAATFAFQYQEHAPYIFGGATAIKAITSFFRGSKNSPHAYLWSMQKHI